MTAARDGRDQRPTPEDLERDLAWAALEVAISTAAQGHPMRFAADIMRSLAEQGFEIRRKKEQTDG